MASLGFTAIAGTAEKFRELFSPDQANSVDSAGSAVLGLALANTKPEDRYEIATLLLDSGAKADFQSGPEGEPALRILLSARRHDAKKTTRLAVRLLEAGADLNARSRRGDGLLDALKTLPGPEDEWLSLYDVLFSQGLVGFEIPNRVGVSPLEGIRKRQPEKAELLKRIEAIIERPA